MESFGQIGSVQTFPTYPKTYSKESIKNRYSIDVIWPLCELFPKKLLLRCLSYAFCGIRCQVHGLYLCPGGGVRACVRQRACAAKYSSRDQRKPSFL